MNGAPSIGRMPLASPAASDSWISPSASLHELVASSDDCAAGAFTTGGAEPPHAVRNSRIEARLRMAPIVRHCSRGGDAGFASLSRLAGPLRALALRARGFPRPRPLAGGLAVRRRDHGGQ